MQTKDWKNVGRISLGAMLVTTGIGHLSFMRRGFRAQVPDFVPLKKDDTVVYSGYAEIALGLALIFANKKSKKFVGITTATLFGAVFPGNIAQYTHNRSAFGLNTNNRRLMRLFFQPVLMYWAFKSTHDNEDPKLM